jgi:hypothetical protein
VGVNGRFRHRDARKRSREATEVIRLTLLAIFAIVLSFVTPGATPANGRLSKPQEQSSIGHHAPNEAAEVHFESTDSE